MKVVVVNIMMLKRIIKFKIYKINPEVLKNASKNFSAKFKIRTPDPTVIINVS